jgi:hypothetical protein
VLNSGCGRAQLIIRGVEFWRGVLCCLSNAPKQHKRDYGSQIVTGKPSGMQMKQQPPFHDPFPR